MTGYYAQGGLRKGTFFFFQTSPNSFEGGNFKPVSPRRSEGEGTWDEDGDRAGIYA